MLPLSHTFVLEFNVRGAGVDAVNGDYRLERFTEDGEEEGNVSICHRYVKAGKWKGNDCEFCLHSVLQSSGETVWFISILHENDDETVHFYSSDKTPWCHSCFWTTDEDDSGISPEPKVTAKAMVTDVPTGRDIVKGQLFSEMFSDFKFVCQDGETIHAHKNILHGASPYFNAAFSGRWCDIDELQTNHAASVIKAVLTLLYTGDAFDAFDRIKKAEDPVAFLRAATEYQIDSLKELTELLLIESLTFPLLKDLWQTARHYDCNALKRACVDYVLKNKIDMDVFLTDVVNPLGVEDTPSAQELCGAMRNAIDALIHASEHDDHE